MSGLDILSDGLDEDVAWDVDIRLASIMKEAMTARKEGKIVLVAQMNKNKKFQKEQLGKEGYSEFKEFYKEDLKH